MPSYTAIGLINRQRVKGTSLDPQHARYFLDYVDGIATQVDSLTGAAGDFVLLDPVAAASSENVNLAAAPATIDGVALAAGVEFGAFGQTTATQNGVYVSAGVGSAAVRRSDMAAAAALDGLYMVEVSGGPKHGGDSYKLDARAGLTVDTDALPFALSSSPDRDSFQVPVYIGPNVAVTESRLAEESLTVTGIKVLMETAPTTAGTYTLAITGAGNNLFSAATFDLKTLVSGTVSTMTLTATAANLKLTTDDAIAIVCTSNNLDLTGAGLIVVLQYKAR